MEYQECKILDQFKVQLNNCTLSHRVSEGNLINTEKGVFKPKLFQEGIVVGFNGELFIDYCSGEYLISTTVLFLISQNNEEILTKYAYYYMLANKDWLVRIFQCMNKKISVELLSNFTIKYPPIADQYNLVQKLDVAFNLHEWQLNAYGILSCFPYSYYKRMEKVSGTFWSKEVKLGKLVDIRQGKEDKKQAFLNVMVLGDRLEFSGKSKVSLTIKNHKCNPYFLACSLPSKRLFRLIESFTICNKIPLLQMENMLLKLPSKKEQYHLEHLFKSVDEVKNNMKELIKLVRALKRNYLHYYLYRKNFGVVLSRLTQKEITKYSYKHPSLIDSLQTFDAIREEVYKSLQKEDWKQYYNSLTNSVSLRRK